MSNYSFIQPYISPVLTCIQLSGMVVSLHDVVLYPESYRVAWACCSKVFLFLPSECDTTSVGQAADRSAKLAGLQWLKNSAPCIYQSSETIQDYWAGFSKNTVFFLIHSVKVTSKINRKGYGLYFICSNNRQSSVVELPQYTEYLVNLWL